MSEEYVVWFNVAVVVESDNQDDAVHEARRIIDDATTNVDEITDLRYDESYPRHNDPR